MTLAPAGAATLRRDDSAELDFTALMAPFAPFETAPELAVAVSGGGDSMALALLAHDWARMRGGCITALTIDHGLRPEAAAEAAQTAAWCAARGIDHVTLRWAGPRPHSGVQAAARAARYRLLEDWCREHLVLHLLLAHHREDQAETIAIRHASGSGVDGLAGMASIAERGAVRLLRPLLGVARTRLRAFLIARGQAWIEDPSNRNPVFTRVRLRATLGHAAAGSGDAHLAATAARLGRERAAGEAEDARALARWAMLDPAGFAWLEARGFTGPQPLGLKAFGALLATISGAAYPPRRERLERLLRELAAGLGHGRTLGGCLIVPRRGRVLVCREPAAVAAPMSVPPGATRCWDGRFQLVLDAAAPAGLSLGALGSDRAAAARRAPKSALARVPPAARATLPALRDAKGVVAVPGLEYFEDCRQEAKAACRVQFRPIRSLTGAGFAIV
jgi:tRNA(Ile)-lysidine synthase